MLKKRALECVLYEADRGEMLRRIGDLYHRQNVSLLAMMLDSADGLSWLVAGAARLFWHATHRLPATPGDEADKRIARRIDASMRACIRLKEREAQDRYFAVPEVLVPHVDWTKINLPDEAVEALDRRGVEVLILSGDESVSACKRVYRLVERLDCALCMTYSDGARPAKGLVRIAPAGSTCHDTVHVRCLARALSDGSAGLMPPSTRRLCIMHVNVGVGDFARVVDRCMREAFHMNRNFETIVHPYFNFGCDVWASDYAALRKAFERRVDERTQAELLAKHVSDAALRLTLLSKRSIASHKPTFFWQPVSRAASSRNVLAIDAAGLIAEYVERCDTLDNIRACAKRDIEKARGLERLFLEDRERRRVKRQRIANKI